MAVGGVSVGNIKNCKFEMTNTTGPVQKKAASKDKDFKMPPPPSGMCLKIMNERNSNEGMGSETSPLNFLDQDFVFWQNYCLKNKQRFVDEYFPPNPRSIGEGLLRPDVMAQVEWVRPTKLCLDAEFVVDGVSRFDYAQGQVGNCWFLASVGSLTFQRKLFLNVVPGGQSFNHDYAGIFHFKFWRFGKWLDVVIDDKLPTIKGKLIFVQSKTYNEFWPALLEKAYAKVCGSYADMHAGRVSEALLDFTGGVHVHYCLRRAPPDLWEIMHRAAQSQAIMGCESPPGNEKKLSNGIVLGHAYTVTGVYQVLSGRFPIQLVRLFNPWGDTEWNGDWSDNSPLWNTVREEDRKQLLVAENGEFWMSVKDFTTTFDNMDICCPCPDFLDGVSTCKWVSKYHTGSWVAGTTAGGCMNYKDTFCSNPQFWLKIKELDRDCKQRQNNVLVSLMQKPDKRNRRFAVIHAIGFSVFAVPHELRSEVKFGGSFFGSRKPVLTTAMEEVRQVMNFFRLEPGEYLIVPYTDLPNKNADFILNIICQNEIRIQKDTEKSEKGFLVNFTEMSLNASEQVDDSLKNRSLFRQFSDQYKDVDAEKLQQFLHENLLGGNVANAGFGLDTCRSMIAMSDFCVTGRLDTSEFIRLWDRITKYKDIFYSMRREGVLSVDELQVALQKTGLNLNEDVLNIMGVRYGGASAKISLEGFICLVMRLKCMAGVFQRLCDKGKITLDESEWIGLTMYS